MPPTDSEKNRFSARAKRYAKVGTRVGGVAARVASQRFLGAKPDRSGNALALAAALGGLKGPIMKVAQLLATIPDAVPPEYAAELINLGLTLIRALLQQQVHVVDHAALHPPGLGVVLADDRAVGDRIDHLGGGHQLVQRALGVEQGGRNRVRIGRGRGRGWIGGGDAGGAQNGQAEEGGGGRGAQRSNSHHG